MEPGSEAAYPSTSTKNPLKPVFRPAATSSVVPEIGREQPRLSDLQKLAYSCRCALQTAISLEQRFGIPRDVLDHEQVAILAFQAYKEKESVIVYPYGWIARVVRNMLVNEAVSGVRRGLDRSLSLNDPRLNGYVPVYEVRDYEPSISLLSEPIRSRIASISPLRRIVVERLILNHEAPRTVCDELQLSAASLRQLVSRTKRQLKILLADLIQAPA